MPPSLAARVAVVERQVQMLQELPGRITSLEARVASLETQFVQFRAEVKEEFLATRESLRTTIEAGNEETRRYMRVLHEDAIARIKVLGEK